MSSSTLLPTPEDIELIISDVDGTLLTSDHKIHPRTLNAFRVLRKKRPGLPIIIASGKQYESCRWIRDVLELDLDLSNFPGEEEGEDGFRMRDGNRMREQMIVRNEIGRNPAVHCNGSLIYAGSHQAASTSTFAASAVSASGGIGGGGNTDSGDSQSAEKDASSRFAPPIVEKHTLGLNAVMYLVEKTLAYGTFLFTPGEVLLVNRGEGVNNKDWCSIAGAYDSCVKDHAKTAEEREELLRSVREGELEIVKVTICADESDLDHAAQELLPLPLNCPSPIVMTRAIPFIFEAIPASVSKSTALVSISRLLSVPRSKMLAFGDGENDIGMLNLAGYGVVMGNAMRSLKDGAVGKFVTGTNDEGGVGMFLERVYGL